MVQLQLSHAVAGWGFRHDMDPANAPLHKVCQAPRRKGVWVVGIDGGETHRPPGDAKSLADSMRKIVRCGYEDVDVLLFVRPPVAFLHLVIALDDLNVYTVLFSGESLQEGCNLVDALLVPSYNAGARFRESPWSFIMDCMIQDSAPRSGCSKAVFAPPRPVVSDGSMLVAVYRNTYRSDGIRFLQGLDGSDCVTLSPLGLRPYRNCSHMRP